MTPPELTESQLHVWTTQSQLPAEVPQRERYWSLLSEDERLHNRAIKNPKIQWSHLLTRALARTALSHYSHISPAELQIVPSSSGKPELIGVDMPLYFNLSHSDDMIVCAVSLLKTIGIDLEYLPRRNRWREIAEQYFSKAEISLLDAQPAERQRHFFFKIWTLKEAYLKATGKGITKSLDAFSFDLQQDSITLKLKGKMLSEPSWIFHSHLLKEDYITAIAVKQKAANTIQKILFYEGIPSYSFEVQHIFNVVTQDR